MALDTKTLQRSLQDLDDLLVRERHAIVYLQVGQLDAIQQDKIRVLQPALCSSFIHLNTSLVDDAV